jgi:Arc/MetJ family transcription regulator
MRGGRGHRVFIRGNATYSKRKCQYRNGEGEISFAPGPFRYEKSLILHNDKCKLLHMEGGMATNLAIDETLLEEALKVGGFKTKKETVNVALKELIQRRKQEDVVRMFSSVRYDKNYNYKKMRERP